MNDLGGDHAYTFLRTLDFWPRAAVRQLDNAIILVSTAEQALMIFNGPSGPELLSAVTGLNRAEVVELMRKTESFLRQAKAS